eukprot:EG_transcript_29878
MLISIASLIAPAAYHAPLSIHDQKGIPLLTPVLLTACTTHTSYQSAVPIPSDAIRARGPVTPAGESPGVAPGRARWSGGSPRAHGPSLSCPGHIICSAGCTLLSCLYCP